MVKYNFRISFTKDIIIIFMVLNKHIIQIYYIIQIKTVFNLI